MDITIALQRAVRSFEHGTPALAARLGISQTSLLHKVSPTYPTAHCSPEEAVEIMQVTGDHGALHAMAGPLGYVLLRRRRFTGRGRAPARWLARWPSSASSRWPPPRHWPTGA